MGVVPDHESIVSQAATSASRSIRNRTVTRCARDGVEIILVVATNVAVETSKKWFWFRNGIWKVE